MFIELKPDDIITSDTHYGHFNVIGYCNRPYSNVWEMNEDLIAKFNTKATPESRVFFLGDFCMNPKYMAVLNRLNRKEWTHVLGNHDKGYKNIPSQVQKYKDWGVDLIAERLVATYKGQKFLLCHLPWFDPSANITNYVERRPRQEQFPDYFLLHGHQHNPKERRLKPKSFDVGVDGNDMNPYTMEEIWGIISENL